MYEKFYGLTARPFDLTPDPRYLVATPIHQEAINNLDYGIASRKGITLLVGEAGTGKTTAIRAAMAKQPTTTHCVHLQNPALTRPEFLKMLAVQFGLSRRARACKAEMLLELEALLRSRRDAKEATILIVDEAQSLPEELLDEVRLLTNVETNSEKLLPLVIAGQPEIAQRLNDPSFRQLKQRIALRCELRPLTMKESAGYIAGRIRYAGGDPAAIFTREAVVLIHEYSRGIPRTINVLCDNALLGGFAAQQRPVHKALIREVCRDFDISAARAAAPQAPAAPPAAAVPQPAVAPPGERAARPISPTEQRILDAAITTP